MKLKRLALAALLPAATAFSAAHAAPTTINFDGAVQTNITNAYAGLTFSAPLAGTAPVRTWSSPVSDTGNNVLGLSGQNNFYAFNQSNGAIDIVFDTAVSFVSIRAAFVVATDAFLGIGGTPFMAVYNSATISLANRIGLDQWDIAGDACLSGNFCYSAFDTLAFTSASADIKAIRLSGFVTPGGGVSRQAIFDTLSYDRVVGGGGGGGGTVAEPSSLLLAGLAGAGLLVTRRRRTAVC